jgi:putative transposase
MDFTDRASVREFLKENDIGDLVQLNTLLKEMTGVLVEEMLEAERDAHLGYAKYAVKDKETPNSRNGHSKKRVRSRQGNLELNIPRDRAGTFEPQLIGKYQRDISQIENQILSLYARGVTERDIAAHMEEIYGATLSPQTISNIVMRVQPVVEEWRHRPLASIYAILYIDGIRYKVRDSGQIKEKTVYGLIGIDLQGHKDVLGLYVFEQETAKDWLRVLTDIRNRGVQDILIVTSDDLPGVEEAITAVYPDALYQGCVVHVIRNSLKYVPYKQKRAFSKEMRAIYQAPTEEAALEAYSKLEESWSEECPLAVSVWERNWNRISTMYQFTPEIRRLIYTTNPIESFHRQLRKVSKNRSIFPDDYALLRLLYLATEQITNKWSKPIREWQKILDQLAIHFEERIRPYFRT